MGGVGVVNECKHMCSYLMLVLSSVMGEGDGRVYVTTPLSIGSIPITVAFSSIPS